MRKKDKYSPDGEEGEGGGYTLKAHFGIITYYAVKHLHTQNFAIKKV
jgi:hypothetical protein